MTNSSQSIKTADYYFNFLKDLQHDTKLDLITKLSESLKLTEQPENKPLALLFGAYQSEETAEEIVANIRRSRVFSRKIETL